MSTHKLFVLNLLCCAAGAGLGNYWTSILNGGVALGLWLCWYAEEKENEP